jgi:hypothetical protein
MSESIDFDRRNASALVHDLLLSYLFRYSQLQDTSRESVVASDQLLQGAVTELIRHFTFPDHVHLPGSELWILSKVCNAAGTQSNSG